MSPTQNNGAGAAILAEVKALREENKALTTKVDALMRHLGLGANRQAAPAASGGSGSGGGGGAIGTMEDIRGKYGDPKLGKMPKNWKHENCEGKRASQCSPEVLEDWAGFLDWKADNPREGKEQYSKLERLDAARCRRWAIEIREGRVQREAPPARPTPNSAQSGDDPWAGPGADEWGEGDPNIPF